MSHKLIIIRHGQSLGNVNHHMYREPDSAICLTEMGVMQALHAAQQLNEIHDDYLCWGRHGVHVFASEYSRARQTARIVLDKMNLRHVEPIISPGINERHYGDFHFAEGDPRYESTPHFRPDNGETMIEARKRFARWYKYNAEFLLTDGDVVLFCHGELLRVATAHILDLDNEEMLRLPIPNATPFIYEYDSTAESYTRSEHKFTHLQAGKIKEY